MTFNEGKISMAVSPDTIAKIEKVMAAWQVAADADMTAKGFTHHMGTDRVNYAVHYHIGGKYVRFDIGSSGAFMADIFSGWIYGIKGYGKVDTKKVIGNFLSDNFDARALVRDRFRRGSFANTPEGGISR